MAARLWLVRHAKAGAIDGDYDRLSALGDQQARRLGQWFAARDTVFDLAASGTLQRQRQTLTAALAETARCPIEPADPALDELPFQALLHGWRQQQPAPVPADGDFAALLRAAISAWIDGELAQAPLSWPAFRARASDWLHRCRARHHGARDLLVISSGGTIATLITAVLDAPDRTMLAFNLQLRNTGVCELLLSEHRAHLVSFNALPHLSGAADRTLHTLI